jgi:hypothetical protein
MLKEVYEEARSTWLCRGCLTPAKDSKAIDARIQELTPNDPPLNFINGCSLGVITKDCLKEIGAALVERDLYVGRLYGPDGELIPDWVTFRGREPIIVRGSKNVSHRRCADCGRIVYFGMGKPYLYPMPAEYVDIFDSGCGGLVLREYVFSRLNLRNWRGVTIDQLPVVEEPADSLGVLG